jgi:hypothetical protein
MLRNLLRVINDLTTGGVNAALSAEQGKTLQTNKAETTSIKTLVSSSTLTVTPDGGGTNLTLAVPTGAPIVVGGITSGSAVAAGNVGEQLSASATGVSLATTATAQTITSKALTAGFWRVELLVVFDGTAGTLTSTTCGVGLVTNAAPSDPNTAQDVRTGTVPSSKVKMVAPARYMNLSAPATAYGIALATFGTSCTCDAYLTATRIA